MFIHCLRRSALSSAWCVVSLLTAALALSGAQCGAPNGQDGALTADAGADQTINAGQNAVLNGSSAGGVPPYTFSWSASGFGGSNQQSPTVSPALTTVFTLQVTDSASPAATAQDTVTVTVTSPASCGNGTVDAGEACDDGNTASGDGCDQNCAVESCTPGDWRQAAKLLAADGKPDAAFGWSVSLSGDVAVIGASQDDDKGLRAGAAYVFRRSGGNWTQEKKLLADDGAAEDLFGASVSVDGDVIVVGAWGGNDKGANSGAAYVYRRNGADWVQEQKLLPNDGAAGDVFGSAVSVSGAVALISAPSQNDNGTNSGAVYAYRFDGSVWQQEQKLLANDGNRDDAFGQALALDGDAAVIGAHQDSDIEDYEGSAYVFRFNGTNWLQEQKLLANDGEEDDRFGQAVAISGDLVVVGAYQDDVVALDSGSAYVFRRTGSAWNLEKKIVPSDGGFRTVFGWSVSIFGEQVVVGAPGAAANGTDSGAAYVFRDNGGTWAEQKKLLPSDGAAGQVFGYSVSAAEDRALIGAYNDNDKGAASGSAYLFEVCGE